MFATEELEHKIYCYSFDPYLLSLQCCMYPNLDLQLFWQFEWSCSEFGMMEPDLHRSV